MKLYTRAIVWPERMLGGHVGAVGFSPFEERFHD